VSRSEADKPSPADPKVGSVQVKGSLPQDEPEYNELSIRIRISYKTLVFAFVLFGVLQHTVNVVIDSEFVQYLYGL
jgi:hypothetical protein